MTEKEWIAFACWITGHDETTIRTYLEQWKEEFRLTSDRLSGFRERLENALEEQRRVREKIEKKKN